MVLTMRLINIPIFALCLASYACAETSDVPAVSGFTKAGFVKEYEFSGARKLIGWSGDHLFVAKQDGSIDEVDHEGRKTLTLQAKDREGSFILRQPQAVAVADGIIYVVDSDSNLVAMFSLEG